MDNFDLKKFLTENQLTSVTRKRTINESKTVLTEMEQIQQYEDELAAAAQKLARDPKFLQKIQPYLDDLETSAQKLGVNVDKPTSPQQAFDLVVGTAEEILNEVQDFQKDDNLPDQRDVVKSRKLTQYLTTVWGVPIATLGINALAAQAAVSSGIPVEYIAQGGGSMAVLAGIAAALIALTSVATSSANASTRARTDIHGKVHPRSDKSNYPRMSPDDPRMYENTTTTNDIVFEFEEIIESQEGDFEGTGALASYTCPRFPSLELIVDGNIDGTGFFQPIGIVELKKA